MGRAPMGSEGRTVQAGLKITKVEEAALSERFGSPGKGLRAILDQWKQGWQHRRGPQVHGGPVLAATHELTDAPIDYGDHYVPFEAEAGASVVGMTDQEMAAALALDQVKQALPMGAVEDVEDVEARAEGATKGPRLGTNSRLDFQDEEMLPGTIEAGVDSPDVPLVMDTNPAWQIPKHRHRRGASLETYWDAGVKKHTYRCATDGCPVVLS